MYLGKKGGEKKHLFLSKLVDILGCFDYAINEAIKWNKQTLVLFVATDSLYVPVEPNEALITSITFSDKDVRKELDNRPSRNIDSISCLFI